ncbi:MAG: TonB-dependent receptor [Bacteroidaceae bacterium]|nr:TonB-dependent receptor [Bacteroidaceae bacterium]
MKQVKNRISLRILALLCGLFISLGAFAQVAVKGHVKDDTGEPVFGATVRVVGQQGGTSTDFDGNFSISAPQGGQISISFMGFQTVTVPVRPTINVTLQEDAKVLEDVVVIGYGTVKKTDLTGSVVALKPETKNKGIVLNAQDMLQGKVAGLSVTSDGGDPNGGSTLRIRGGASLNASSDPLYVIDGVIMDNASTTGMSNPLSMVNPQDIESFNILKDASATAIYGSRGSNGVIIITTKKGRKGQKMALSYNGSVTMSTSQKTIDVMTGDEFRNFVTNLFGSGSTEAGLLGTANTDWQKEIYRTAISHDHNISVQGAAGFLPYRVSVGYTDQQGILKTSDYKRVTGSVNLNPSFLDDHLTLNISAKGMYSRPTHPDRSAIGNALTFDPSQSVMDWSSADATNWAGYFEWPGSAAAYGDPTWTNVKNNLAPGNPVALLDLNNTHSDVRSFIGNAELVYKVHGFEDLSAHVNVSGDFTYGKSTNDVSPASPANMYYGSYGWNDMQKKNTSLNAYAQYLHDWNSKHVLDITAGYEWQHYWRETNSHTWGLYPTTHPTNGGQKYNEYENEWKTEHYLVSFFGRVNYTLLDKFLFTATLRDDGSSRFSDHWALFPSAAFAWKLKEEPLIKRLDYVSDAKLRLSYGRTGQQELYGLSGQNPDYLWIPTYLSNTGNGSYYPIDGTGALSRPEAYDTNLKWETTTTYNIGLDLSYFKNRLSFSLDGYIRNTEDLLSSAVVRAGSNYKNRMIQNIGKMRNYGFEFSVDWKAIQTKDWFWTLGFNATYNKNEITELNGGEDDYMVPTGRTPGDAETYAQAHKVGYPVAAYYVYQQVYDENGKPLEGVVVDRNGDGQITADGDRYFYKSPYAPWAFGFSSRLEWKHWDLGFNLRANVGNYVYNAAEAANLNVSKSAVYNTYLANRPTSVLDNNWQTWNQTGKISDYFVRNGSFLKCDNITLGYSFENLFRSQNFRGVAGRLYLAANNVFTITKYDGLDPEVFGGIDNNVYPRPFSMMLGLNLNY